MKTRRQLGQICLQDRSNKKNGVVECWSAGVLEKLK